MVNKKGIIYGMISAILFGLSGVIATVLFKKYQMIPTWLVGTRMFWAGLLLLMILAFQRGKRIFAIWRQPRDAIQIILFGTLGMLMAQSSFFLSVYYGDAASATVLQSLGPTTIIIILSVIYRRLPRGIDVVAIVLALVGVVLLITNGQLSHLKLTVPALTWGIISAFGVASYTLLPRPLLKNHCPLTTVAWGLFVGGIVENINQPIWVLPAHCDGQAIILLVAIIIAGTLMPYMFYVLSLCCLTPTLASLLGTLEPLAATLLSILFLGVVILPWQWVGIAIILSTVLLVSLPRRVRVIKKNCS